MKGVNVPTHVPIAVIRGNALLTVLIGMTAAVGGFWWLMAMLMVDFFVRGFLNPRWSPSSFVSGRVLRRLLPFREGTIFFPPKRFAARIGFVFALAAALLGFTGVSSAAIVVTATLVLFASLECFLNICMGCIVYNHFVAPLKKRRTFGT